MTAWAQLILRSTLPSGTAWQHLGAQRSGGTIINDGVVVEVDSLPIEVDVVDTEIIAEVEE